MHILFVHQNFPAQFLHVAPWLAQLHGWHVTFATRNDTVPPLPGVKKVVYSRSGGPPLETVPCARRFVDAAGEALGVFDALKARPDISPDLIVAHSGFGSSLYLPHLYDAPVINFFEHFFHAVGQDCGYRPETAVSELNLLRGDTTNAAILLDLHNCDRGWCPSNFQRDLMPKEYSEKIIVIPEGIDARLYSPSRECGSGAGRRLPDRTTVPRGTRIVTYVSRGFEKMRGFDVFMRAAKRVYEQFPNVLFVIVGSDRVSYGSGEQCGGEPSFREHVLKEDEYDLSRFRFTGWVAEETLAAILRLSDLHVYLTHPFVTSWSMLDAMSCACVVLASNQACTREYITHGENGLLCDFFDVEAMASQMVAVLREPGTFRHLGNTARRTIEAKYSIDVALPRIKSFFEDVVAKGPRKPSVRAELLVRAGRHEPKPVPPVLAPSAAAGPADKLAAYGGAIPFRLDGRGSKGRSPSPQPSPLRTGERGQERKTVLFCWELGGGLGHMMQMLPLAERLSRGGHQVLVALRQLERAAVVFGRAGVSFLQAPCWAGREDGRSSPFPQPITYTQLLCNVGFGDDAELFGRAAAWRNLFRMVRPDLIVFDHAPTALLASRGLPTEPRRALIGSGFCCPPDNAYTSAGAAPWAVLRPQLAVMGDQQRLPDEESRLLARVNRLLGKWKQPAIARLGQLYADADENFLTTFPELDHFPPAARGDEALYWGPVLAHGPSAAAPTWPDGDGPRVFVYLKTSPEVGDLLEKLAATGRATLVYIDGLAPALRRRYETPTLRLSERPVDLAQAARECDAAVLSGGHGATAEVLLAGKPVVEVPAALEQRLGAEAVKRLGAGLDAPPKDAGAIAEALETVLADESYADAAARFARRYERFNPAQQRSAMLARAEELLGLGREAECGARGAALIA